MAREHHELSVTGPGALIAAMPVFLGYYPTESIIAIGLRDDVIVTALRSDIAPVEELGVIAHHRFATILRNTGATSAALVVITTDEPDGHDLPHAVLIDELAMALKENGVPALHRVWTSSIRRGAPWRDYDDPTIAGTVPDPQSTELAATAVANHGQVIWPDRDQLRGQLALQPENVLRRREHLLNGMTLRPINQRHSRTALQEAATAAQDVGTVPQTDEQIAQLLIAVADRVLRDSMLAWSTGPHATSARLLWTCLTRSAPQQWRAAPACLLAVAAHSQGDGVLANEALAVARAADEDCDLGMLLYAAISLGVTPSKLRALAVEVSARANAHLDAILR